MPLACDEIVQVRLTLCEPLPYPDGIPTVPTNWLCMDGSRGHSAGFEVRAGALQTKLTTGIAPVQVALQAAAAGFSWNPTAAATAIARAIPAVVVRLMS